MYFFRKLKKPKFPCQVFINFYRGAIESILTGHITNWHGMCMDRRALQNITTDNIIGTYLPSISDICEVSCLCRAQRILKDNTHPATACSPCCCLASNTEISAAVPPDSRATSFFSLWYFSIQPPHSTINNNFFVLFCMKGLQLAFCYTTLGCIVKFTHSQNHSLIETEYKYNFKISNFSGTLYFFFSVSKLTTTKR